MTNLLPSPQELKEKFPLANNEKQFLFFSRQKAQKIVEGIGDTLAVIVGPCSIHDPEAALEYATRLKYLTEKLSLFIVMRVFFEKPRTTIGWKGLLYDPYLNGTHDITAGLYATRELLVKLTQMKIPIATEFVDPIVAPYFEDLITWGFIGARTSSSQPHRQLASGFPFPVGIKNALDGDITPAIHGVIAARSPHIFAGINNDGSICKKTTFGNPHSHIVLRGSQNGPNYMQATSLYPNNPKNSDLSAPKPWDWSCLGMHGITSKIMIDCSHGNCEKNYETQKEVFLSVLKLLAAGNTQIIGMMLESHLIEGNQALTDDLRYGVSITDPCIGWSMTEELLSEADEQLSISSNVIRFTQS